MTNPEPLSISYDQALDILTINGVNYSGALFRAFATDGIAIGRWFKIVSRGDGIITLFDAPEGARITWEPQS